MRAALRERPALALRPAALGPALGEESLLGPVTAAAEAAGVQPGMRMGEALSLCPELALVEQDPAAAEDEWEQLLKRLEDSGFAVEPVALGCAYFETRGIERLYGGLEPALKRALAAVGAAWDARIGAADRRFAALAAANVARSGQALIVSDRKTRDFLAPLPLTLLPVDAGRRAELEELGVRKLGQLAGLPGAAVAERLGPDGRRAWSLARGEKRGKVHARKVANELAETLEFPEAVANELTLRRALGALLDRLLAQPGRGDRAVRKVALSAKLVSGGSWRRTVTLRDATADRARLRPALGPKLAELPAPVVPAWARGGRARAKGGQSAGARPAGGFGAARSAQRRLEAGARRRRLRRGVLGPGGRSLVANPRAASTAGSARRLNAPAPAM